VFLRPVGGPATSESLSSRYQVDETSFDYFVTSCEENSVCS
jgi:hypothetical protein